MKILGMIWLMTGALMAFQPPSVHLNGTVLDLNGEPVNDASIHITHKEGQKLDKSVSTKKNGRFNVLSIPAGLLNIEVSKPGFQSQTFEFDLRPERKRATLRLIPEGKSIADLAPQTKLSGAVYDSSGNGIPEVSLKLTSPNLPGFEKEVVTDASGAFEVEVLNDAVIQIHAHKGNYRDTIYKYYHPDKDTALPERDLTMQTLEEAYAELGKELPEKKMKPEAQAIELYNLAVVPYKEGNLDQAEKYALKALELDPNQHNAMRMLVYIYFGKKEWEKADQYSKAFLAEKPGDPGMTKYAEQVAQKLKNPGASSDGASVDGLFNQAITAINNNDDATASGLLKKAIEMDDTYALAHFELGKIYVREFEFEKAIHELKLYLKHAPADHKYRKEATDLIVTLAE